MAAIPSTSPFVGPAGSPLPSNADPRSVSGRGSQQQQQQQQQQNSSTTRPAYTPASNMLPTVSQIQPAVTSSPQATPAGLQAADVPSFVMPPTAGQPTAQLGGGGGPFSGVDNNTSSAMAAAGTNNPMAGGNFAGQPSVSMERMQQQQMQMAPMQLDMTGGGGRGAMARGGGSRGGSMFMSRPTTTNAPPQQVIDNNQQPAGAGGALMPFGVAEQMVVGQQKQQFGGGRPGLVFPACGGMMPSANMSMPALNGKPLMYFNPRQSGYDDASGGQDPRQGYPLVYPYVPMRDNNNERKEKSSKKKKTGCC
eukprot:GHVS01018440.1.p1 GENE.GHVS01018440.1~~GHVS01018440.1.p1  ORF type:complete len:361 (-),score=117.95 GHVS01018440.1:398-1321(-)